MRLQELRGFSRFVQKLLHNGASDELNVDTLPGPPKCPKEWPNIPKLRVQAVRDPLFGRFLEVQVAYTDTGTVDVREVLVPKA